LEKAKVCYGGLILGGSDLGSSLFSILLQLLQKMMLASKVVKSDSKIIITLG